MSIAKKLTICFGAMLTLTLVLGVTCLSVTGDLGSELDHAVNSTGRAVEQMGLLTTALAEMKGAETSFILFSSLNDTTQSAAATQKFRDGAEAMRNSITNVRSAVGASGSVMDELSKLSQGLSEMVPMFDRMQLACQSQKCNEALDAHLQKMIPLAARMEQIAGRLAQDQRERRAQSAGGAARKTARSRMAAIVLLALSVGIGITIFLVLRHVNATLERVSGELQASVDQIVKGAEQLSHTGQTLAHCAASEAQSVDEGSAAAQQIAASVKQHVGNANKTTELVDSGHRSVNAANQTLSRMAESMRAISRSSHKISAIIKTVEEIAFKTNILALNAAVEAARAGQAGQGFAVVADEVRNLAQSCSRAARETADLIEESTKRSTEGATVLSEVTDAVNGITDNFRRIKELVEEVSAGSQEQARGIDRVAVTMSRVRDLTQQTAGQAQESAATSQELNAQSMTIKDMSRELNRLVGGGVQVGQGEAETSFRRANSTT